MNIAVLLIEEPSGKVLIAKSKEFSESFVLPFYKINTQGSLIESVDSHVANEFNIKPLEVELINSGEYSYNETRSTYDLMLVRVSAEFMPSAAGYDKLVWMDPHKAIKLVFTEPFTLCLVDYLRKMGK